MKLLFSHIAAGFFVTIFLLGIIICFVYIIYVLSQKEEGGKPFMHFFTVRYFREVKDGGELKKRVRVYRIAPESKKSVPKKRKKAKRVQVRTHTKPSQISQRVYFVDGKPTLQKPSQKIRF